MFDTFVDQPQQQHIILDRSQSKDQITTTVTKPAPATLQAMNKIPASVSAGK